MIRHHLRATPTLAGVSVAAHVAYRAEMTIWILTAILPLIMLAIWDAVAADGAVAGFGRAELARYFVATLVCRQLTGAWVIWELNHEIRTGSLSPQLLRPFHPLWVHAVMMLVALPFRLVVLSPLVALMVVLRPDLIALPSLAALALFVPSILLAWLIAFLAQCFFGTLSFWVDKSDGLFGVWFAAWALLSGYIAPMAMFPAAWRPWLDMLPFRSMLAVPVELLGGFLTPAEALPQVGLQLVWAVVFGLAVQALWTRGVRRYGAFGA